jgi:FkbM family methyltransferase
MKFEGLLKERVRKELKHFYTDNFDAFRFGRKTWTKRYREAKSLLLSGLARTGIYPVNPAQLAERRMGGYMDRLEQMYLSLSGKRSKDLMVDLIAFRMLGYPHVKLPVNTPVYWQKLDKYERQAEKTGWTGESFMNVKLHKFDLRELGYDASLYYTPQAVLIYLDMEQYAYTEDGLDISVKKGDCVIDAGGCLGDTAVYFASKTGPGGKVFSFEFIPDTLTGFQKNLELNAHLKDRIQLVESPLWDKADLEVYFNDKGSGSRVELKPFDGYTHTTKTITIDELVRKGTVPRVDFIKMDIEGAELMALKGAENAIRSFKPRMAISIYHSMNDFVDIPNWIAGLGIGYKIYLGHYTIHAEETILYAIAD